MRTSDIFNLPNSTKEEVGGHRGVGGVLVCVSHEQLEWEEGMKERSVDSRALIQSLDGQ